MFTCNKDETELNMVLCCTHKAITSISEYNYPTCCAVSWPKCKYRLSGVHRHYLGWPTHTHMHTPLSPPQCGAISGSQAGSQGAVTGLLELPGTLSISSLIPSCLGRSRQACGLTRLPSERAMKHYRQEHKEQLKKY